MNKPSEVASVSLLFIFALAQSRNSVTIYVLNVIRMRTTLTSIGTPSTSSAQMDTLLQTLSLPEGLEKTYSQFQKDEHKKRLGELRKGLEYLKTTDWQFKPVDELIGK